MRVHPRTKCQRSRLRGDPGKLGLLVRREERFDDALGLADRPELLEVNAQLPAAANRDHRQVGRMREVEPKSSACRRQCQGNPARAFRAQRPEPERRPAARRAVHPESLARPLGTVRTACGPAPAQTGRHAPVRRHRELRAPGPARRRRSRPGSRALHPAPPARPQISSAARPHDRRARLPTRAESGRPRPSLAIAGRRSLEFIERSIAQV